MKCGRIVLVQSTEVKFYKKDNQHFEFYNFIFYLN